LTRAKRRVARRNQPVARTPQAGTQGGVPAASPIRPVLKLIKRLDFDVAWKDGFLAQSGPLSDRTEVER
jgi:hypothetical protein